MDNDDRQIGRILSRREVLALIGASGVAVLVGCGPAQPAGGSSASAGASLTAEAASGVATAQSSPTASAEATAAATSEATAAATPAASAVAALPSCIVRPELTEGPYFVDEVLNRSDIRVEPSDNSVKPGVPLEIVFQVSDVSGSSCAPLAGAQVDVWHCDAEGVYSGVTDRGFSTVGTSFLRGYQLTDADGTARFTTIFPGWYSGRAVHIHFKIRNDGSGGSTEFTSQFFFDPALVEQIYARAPYADKGSPDTPNSRDGIYRSGGEQLLLTLTPVGDGYTTTFDVGLQQA